MQEESWTRRREIFHCIISKSKRMQEKWSIFLMHVFSCAARSLSHHYNLRHELSVVIMMCPSLGRCICAWRERERVSKRWNEHAMHSFEFTSNGMPLVSLVCSSIFLVPLQWFYLLLSFYLRKNFYFLTQNLMNMHVKHQKSRTFNLYFMAVLLPPSQCFSVADGREFLNIIPISFEKRTRWQHKKSKHMIGA